MMPAPIRKPAAVSGTARSSLAKCPARKLRAIALSSNGLWLSALFAGGQVEVWNTAAWENEHVAAVEDPVDAPIQFRYGIVWAVWQDRGVLFGGEGSSGGAIYDP